MKLNAFILGLILSLAFLAGVQAETTEKRWALFFGIGCRQYLWNDFQQNFGKVFGYWNRCRI